ncbi:MAG: efflux RND transporter periplasmic adaptor subunit [Verrucomicrobiae bacterium]|nr:efflux RND transporter periplasmic adaptor subunit [Verrucomicrobiae bacterium]
MLQLTGRPFPFAILTAAAAVLVATTGCTPPDASSARTPLPVVEVSIHAAHAGVHPAIEEIVGTVRSRRRAALEAKVSGRISQVFAAPGQSVAAGQLLVVLDADDIAARVRQSRAVLEQTERDLARVRTLLGEGAVTQAEFDATEARFRVAQAAVSESETLLGYAQVTAPFAGIVTRKHAEVGDMASPGRPLLELEDPDALRFEADVPVTLLDRLTLGDRLSLRIVSLDAPVEGVVGEIEPSADAASGTFRVRIDLPPRTPARAGLFGRLAVPVGESNLLTIPQSALATRGQLELVHVVAGDHARLRLVRTGRRLGPDVEILAGLEPGESVVVDRPGPLADGQPVRVR